ncbi:MAG TPA: TolC family protein [Candidatus Acidoferrum sp.]|jgi:cobalt-zinc-cadmium efflux system outer membrane protein
MRRFIRGVLLGVFLMLLAGQAEAQKFLTWDEVRAKFEANNPTLNAGKVGIDESKANEITAYVRPNPQWSVIVDQIGHTTQDSPFSATTLTTSVNYLHERQHKRELRRESAERATGIAISGQSDLERNLVFMLRSAFVGTLQAKAVLRVATENLKYWDQVLKISHDRFDVGNTAQVDLDRMELQRVQYESDVQTADVNLRTAKIQLLMLLNDRTPVDEFDVLGLFEYNDNLSSLDEFRKIAADTRPDLKAALQSVDKAKTDHQLAVSNGSTDPTFSIDAGFPTISQAYLGYQPPLREYVGGGVSIPLRIFDRNQGEKLRTQLDIDRNQKLLDATQAQVFSDVDSAYAEVNSNLILLRPYKAKYLELAGRVRDTVKFSYEHGGASLLDFLNAEGEYRTVELSYVNLVGSYLTAAAQLNMAVGREVIQ